MAKQSINIVERHVEKGVLGVCGLVLIAAIAMFLVSTPNTVDIQGQQATPEDIDRIVLDKAKNLLTRMRGVKADPPENEPFAEQFSAAASPLVYAGLESQTRAPVPWSPAIPEVKWTPVAGELELASVNSVEDLQVTFGRSTIEPTTPQILGNVDAGVQSGFPEDRNWVTVAARFDQVRQITTFKNAGYKVGKRNPYVYGVDLQRREKLSSGSYADWVDVISYRPIVPPSPPDIVIEQTRKGPIPTVKTQDDVRDFFTLIRKGQVELIRPLFAGTVYGDPWQIPTYADLNVVDLDIELCPQESCEPRDYGVADIADPTETVVKTDAEIIEEQLTLARAARDSRRWSEAQTLADGVIKHRAATPKNVRDAQGILDQARQGERDEARRPGLPTPESGGDADGAERPRSRYQLVWAHDAAAPFDGGAESGKTYQYRMRLRLFNRYCAQPQDLGNASDAEKIELVGDWSPPTGEVHIPEDTVFFLTSGNPRSGVRPKVTVFKWFEGVWTKNSFAVSVGDRVYSKSKHVVHVDANGDEDKPQVVFDANATVVDIIDDYQFPTRKQRGQSFEIEPSETTIALVYVDHVTGELGKRVLSIDKKSRAYKDFKEQVFVAPRR